MGDLYGRRAFERAALRGGSSRRRTCTGITASWCPIHGDCTCPPPPDRDHLCATTCRLHDPLGSHGDDATLQAPVDSGSFR